MPILLRDVVDGALLVEFPGASDVEANGRAVATARRFARRPPRGFFDAIPGARTLLLLFDPRLIGRNRLAREVCQAGQEARAPGVDRRVLRIPVAYGGTAGRDLSELAGASGLSEAEFIQRHAAAGYAVAFLGFAPGFAYLAGLPRELHMPRLPTPRPRVPAGAVGIGGEYTGIYPSETPGGWRLIGRSPVRLFDAEKDPPALLRPGDRVVFEPIEEKEFERIRSSAERARGSGSVNPDQRATRSPGRPTESKPVFRISEAGLWTSVQGGPRYGWASSGVPPGGAMDLAALAFGNALLQNPEGAAALEVTLAGPELEVLADILLALSGAEADVECNGKRILPATVFPVRTGDRLSIGPVRGGARSYLCVAGGLESKKGPQISQRLKAGDTVLLAEPRLRKRGVSGLSGPRNLLRDLSRDFFLAPSGLRRAAPPSVRVVLGPQEGHFKGEGIATFLSTPYRVSPASDRRGIRLQGEPIAHEGSPDIPPEGTALGAIQVPRDGCPIVLGPDRPVTGGYAKIATVIGADFPLVAQAVPGSVLRFRAITLEEALAARTGSP